MEYIHTEIVNSQISKRPGAPCGDVISFDKNKSSTVFMICDGLGSGIKANIAANMCVARMKELISSGFSLRNAFSHIVKTMEEARTKDLPYAVLTVVRILHDGVGIVLSYEMPPPIFISNRYAVPLKTITYSYNQGIISEADIALKKNEGILLVSDGIIQSGLGSVYTNGWGVEGLSKFITEKLQDGAEWRELPSLAVDEAKFNWGEKNGDDCSASLAFCRRANAINILTGPPSDETKDAEFVNKFLSKDGLKIVCGASTAKIVAKHMDKELDINPNFRSTIAPPDYEIEGIDLVTEGAVTLNHLYNIWDEDQKILEKYSPVTELYHLLKVSDRINFFIGRSLNPAGEDISFKQTGTLTRDKIIPLLVQKFKDEQKVVNIEYF